MDAELLALPRSRSEAGQPARSWGAEIVPRPPTPTNDLWVWQMQAACRGMSSSHFFHPWGERGAEREARIERAKQVCAHCPVVAMCREHALQVQEPYGIWGGLSEDERLKLLNRPRRRPRIVNQVAGPNSVGQVAPQLRKGVVDRAMAGKTD